MKLDIMNTKVWPAIMLALKRIAKLKQRIIYENSSIKIKKGNKKKGHSGMNNFKKSMLCVNRPIKKIDRPKVSDKKNIINI